MESLGKCSAWLPLLECQIAVVPGPECRGFTYSLELSVVWRFQEQNLKTDFLHIDLEVQYQKIYIEPLRV